MDETRERYAKYVTELQKIDPTDSQIESKVNNALTRHKILNRHNVHEIVPRMTPRVFPFFAGYNDPFYSFEKRIGKVFTDFDKHFNKMDEVDFASLERELPTDTPSHTNDRAYCKYSSSFTSFDNNGQKKSKTISGVEKVVNGKRYVSKRKRTIDGNNMVEEQFYPDGRKVVTSKSLDKLDNTLKTIE